ncbi:MAG: uroporphyrinogen-III C-methyltransferase [Deltaproteobacteria bacterium]|nr:uroporphyrinogen-III C-methyltransferase [Deltaproteobacteria bacterium]
MTSIPDGKVYLVGAGPGDPGLLTLKAKECLESADVIVYDYLINKIFLNFSGENTELIYVGKKGGAHTVTQDEINRIIIDRAKRGLKVVRLKGGDPFIFGRGGEEAQELRKAGVKFEIVPGITSAIAVPAYAGIPLTHRDYTSTVSIITGHEDPKKDKTDINWEKLATASNTLVFLMGMANLDQIAMNLIKYGRSPSTPAAVIHSGTMVSQKTVTGRLDKIASIAENEDIKAPSVIVVGDVVRLREELNWFEEKPLFGRRILITRAREQASEFKELLAGMGAECIEFPTIEIIPPVSWEKLDEAIASLDRYQWIIFTSFNGAKYFFQRLEISGRDVRDLKGMKIGTIGPKTAKYLIDKGIRIDLIPDEYRAEGIIEWFKKYETTARTILLPRAAGARELLPEGLLKMGMNVNVVEAYRTVKPDASLDSIKKMLGNKEIHLITFTSSSTVNNFMEMFKNDPDDLMRWIDDVSIACIGPITAKTAEAFGLKVSLVPADYTIEALTDLIVRFFS